MDENKNQQPDQEEILDQQDLKRQNLDLTIISACSYVQNCLKRKDFKKSQTLHFDLIKESAESKLKGVIDWLKTVTLDEC